MIRLPREETRQEERERCRIAITRRLGIETIPEPVDAHTFILVRKNGVKTKEERKQAAQLFRERWEQFQQDQERYVDAYLNK